MKNFPEFIKAECNQVSNIPDPSMKGYVFDGVDDVQIVFWECEKGGTAPTHTHNFWEWALVVEGTFDGYIGDEHIHLEAGDECIIPPETEHSGTYSSNYRAIDAFSTKKRLSRKV